MSLENAFAWLGGTPPGVFLAQSTSAFAATETLHLLALAALFGVVVVVDLSALRLAFRATAPVDIARGLTPVLAIALGLIAVSGLLLVAAGPLKYYTNPLFPLKLSALAAALAVQFGLHRALARGHVAAKPLAVVSLVLWLGVIVLGRWLGLI
jgi:hypothetical protein